MPVEHRAFKYDVLLTMHMEPVDRLGKHLVANRRQLVSAEEEAHLRALDSKIEDLLEQVLSTKPSARYIFYVLNHRLSFIWWLLDQLVEGADPSDATDFKFRCKEDKRFQPPKNKKESSIGPLVLGLYRNLDLYIEELLAVVNNSLEGKIFIYSSPENELFDDLDYVKNLSQLADKGLLAARMLKLLIDKLNTLETVLCRLKQAYRKISQPDEWNVYKVNLGTSGFSFATYEEFELFSQMDIFMDIDGEVMICRGKVVSQTDSSDSNMPNQLDVQFDLLTSEQQHKIQLYEQRKELKDAMMQVSIA